MVVKRCVLCGAEFIPVNPRQKMCDKEHYHPCPNCGKPVLAKYPSEVNKCCSRKCGQAIGNKSREATAKAKYGVNNVAKLKHVFKRTCKYCGKAFETSSPRQVYCGDDYYSCPICGKSVKIKSMQQVGAACSIGCRQVLIERTNLERYGSPVSVNSAVCRDQAKKTCLEKYGVDHYSKTQEFKDKYKATSLERYGTEAPLQNDEIKAKQIATNNAKYGGNAPTSSEEVKAKVRATVESRYGGFTLQSEELSSKVRGTNLERYGVENPMQNEEVQAKVRRTNLQKYGAPTFMESVYSYQTSISDPSKAQEYLEFSKDPKLYIESHYDKPPTIYILCQDLGVTDTPVYLKLIEHGCRDLLPFKTSTMEYEVANFIKQILPETEIRRNDRSIIAPLEIDLYLPEYKFGIECNPTITHNSSIQDPWGSDPKSPTYHKKKSLKAAESGIQLFHIFGYEWIHKRPVIESMLANRLNCVGTRIYGRNTEVVELSYLEAKQFLKANHRQGSISAKVFLGLVDRQSRKLVSVMTFNRMRKTLGLELANSETWELSRFCNLLNTTVVGGASKLLKYFVEAYNPAKIVSFSDIAHTSGNLYPTLGFKQVNVSDPGYVWASLHDDSYYTRVVCQKRNLRKLFKDEFIDIDNKTEKQIMMEHGYVQVFDSGVIRWEWVK